MAVTRPRTRRVSLPVLSIQPASQRHVGNLGRLGRLLGRRGELGRLELGLEPGPELIPHPHMRDHPAGPLGRGERPPGRGGAEHQGVRALHHPRSDQPHGFPAAAPSTVFSYMHVLPAGLSYTTTIRPPGAIAMLAPLVAPDWAGSMAWNPPPGG